MKQQSYRNARINNSIFFNILSYFDDVDPGGIISLSDKLCFVGPLIT